MIPAVTIQLRLRNEESESDRWKEQRKCCSTAYVCPADWIERQPRSGADVPRY